MVSDLVCLQAVRPSPLLRTFYKKGIAVTDQTRKQQLIREWEQAWNHNRHLESTRSQYLGFFFTVTLASVSVSIGLMKGVADKDQPAVLTGLLVLGFVVFLITLALFTAIKKIGYVLAQYSTIVNSVRNEMEFPSNKEFPYKIKDLYGYPKEVLESKLFRVQGAAEILLGIAALVLVGVLIAGSLFFFNSNLKFTDFHKDFSLVIVVCASVCAAVIFIPLVNNWSRTIKSNGYKLLVVNALIWLAAFLVPTLIELIPVSQPPKALPLSFFGFRVALAALSTYLLHSALSRATTEIESDE